MSPNDLRRQNLHVLLEGKGAKSALARLISMSPASVSSMLNGGKQLDKEFCNSICHALKLPENWFEHERESKDVPEAVRKKLAPLARGTATPAPALKKAANVAAASEATSGDAPSAAPAQAGSSPEGDEASGADRPQTWPAVGGTKVSKVLRLGGHGHAPAGASASPDTSGDATPPAEAAEAVQTSSAAAGVPSATPSPRKPTKATVATPSAPAALGAASPAAPRVLPAAQAGDVPMAAMSGFVVEGGLSPITEALIKTLAQKARQGSLSEDRAFELLGSVRGL